MPASASDQHSDDNKRDHRDRALNSLSFSATRETLVAKSAAGPNTPTQADDLAAAFATKVRTIIREERQGCEILT